MGDHHPGDGERPRVIHLIRNRRARVPEPHDPVRLVKLAAVVEAKLMTPCKIGVGGRVVGV